MQLNGPLEKLKYSIENPIQYSLTMGEESWPLNELLGSTIALRYTGHIRCFCGEIKDKIYRQNFCYNCFWTLPQAGASIFEPEKSTAHLGIADRDLEFEQRYQLQPHTVYLSLTNGVKVGVTRSNARMYRWVDQGAVEAIVLAETENRHEAGLIEYYLKQYMPDKTNWRKMVSGETDMVNLLMEKEIAADRLSADLRKFLSPDQEIYQLHYPVLQYPRKVQSLNIEKTPEYRGKLSGIKGQYLLFEDGTVFNVRNHEGRIVELWVA